MYNADSLLMKMPFWWYEDLNYIERRRLRRVVLANYNADKKNISALVDIVIETIKCKKKAKQIVEHILFTEKVNNSKFHHRFIQTKENEIAHKLKAKLDLKFQNCFDNLQYILFARMAKNCEEKEVLEKMKIAGEYFNTLEYKTALSSYIPEEIEKLCPVSIFGIDQHFCPIIWYGLNHLANNSMQMLKHFKEEDVLQHFQRNLKLLDNIKCRISRLVEMPITQHIIIIDVNGISFSKAISHRQCVVNIFELVRFYPLSISNIYIINAGFFFRAIWNVVQTYLNKEDRDNITICDFDFLPVLTKQIDIEQISFEIGGKCPQKMISGKAYIHGIYNGIN